MSVNYPRTARLVLDAVDMFDLELDGYTVYTEAATGGFAATAATAVAAGAETVYALARDSSHGSAEQARDHTRRLTAQVGDEQKLFFPDSKRPEHFTEVDIVTNTGFVRPIDEQVADWLGPNAAVPLMFETWEYREVDMDIEALWQHDIPVVGTDERDDRVATQRYLRALAVAIAFECDVEIMKGEFVVLGNGRMASHTVEGLETLGGSVTRVGLNDNDGTATVSAETVTDIDVLFVIDHQTDDLLVGTGGLIDPAVLAKHTPGVTVAHIAGPVAIDDLDAANIRYVPDNPAPPGTMSYTTGHLGPRPIVDLHTAGLRVGADLVREQRRGADLLTATERVTSSPLGMDFDDTFKRANGFYD